MILRDIYEVKHGLEAKLERSKLEPIAETLSTIAKREKPWTWLYIRNVIKGYKNFDLTRS